MSIFKTILRKVFPSKRDSPQQFATNGSVLDNVFDVDTIPACPACTSDNVAFFAYGKPPLSKKYIDGLETGKIIPGGCMINKTNPKWHCHNCNKDFGRLL